MALKFRLHQSAVRFIEGDLEELARLHPTSPATVTVRDLIHKYVRQERAKRGQAPLVPPERAGSSAEADEVVL